MRGYKIFSGTANPEFAKKISKYLSLPLSECAIKTFSDGEISVQIGESVRGKDVFVIQPTCAPTNSNLMELLILTDALKRSSASSITAVVPYFGYARQDRKAAPRVPISAKLVANMMQTAGIDRVVTMDLHAGQIQGFFDVPVDNLYGSLIFLDYLKEKNLKNPIIASPDVGGVARARSFAKKLSLDLVIVDKRREEANKSEVMNIIGDIKDKDCIMIDDIVDTAGSLCEGAKALQRLGARSVYACCSHAILSDPAVRRINESNIEKLIITDTIPLPPEKHSEKIVVLSLADAIGDVIMRIHGHRSVSQLFDKTQQH